MRTKERPKKLKEKENKQKYILLKIVVKVLRKIRKLASRIRVKKSSRWSA